MYGTGLGILDQINSANYNPWYNPMITAKQSSWMDTAITPDPNYKMIRKRKYLNYN